MSKKSKLTRPTFDQELFTVLRAIRGLTPEEAARKAGISASTIRNWRKGPRYGGTKFPQSYTIDKAMAAVGYRKTWVDKATNETLAFEKDNSLWTGGGKRGGKKKEANITRASGRSARSTSARRRNTATSGRAALH